MYNLFYILMGIGFTGVVMYTPDLKSKIIGILCLLVNLLIFWR